MEFSRSRNETEQLIGEDVLVKTKRSFIRSFIEILLTVVFWIYTLVVSWFFVSALLNQNDRYIATLKSALNVTNEDIRGLISFGVLILIGLAILLFVWRTYNKKRYGPLNRRKTPTPTTLEELNNLGLIEPSTIEMLQQDKVIIFEKNPVKELEE
ncbi:poly-beta-1,6-N-acetyl-D-glucosamine biosynthesis protein PgaD [Exiguobacterium aestuarii]|uniref:poly-beta-1,6-N-acetyl-D-glucosamine biosynthesis protein PgaD n=1 Tax=Exiguobacterium aestuarii TaxID=273527 RepID=UPI001CD37FE3|nr:poly-beta-1,6-N-acetyl-D-glucosamine biosynthesis protein PgaD [Exiguobacterium aestuarii]MCA0981158.1 poly-beta-1,6-N-acetyl-D-glucosamine biosynthesis protein PgaD [Exiguobacterium aestuarii]